jgi:Ca-activated chloride channel family protein
MRGLAHPELGLAALGLVVAGALAVLAGHLLARRRAARLLGGAAPRVLPRRSDGLLLAALGAVALALPGPNLGERTVSVPTSGADVVLLFDVSRSMAARDVPPSRLARARSLGDAVLAGLAPGDRAALAAFAGRGVLLTPLTPDAEALRALLPALDDALIAEGGSRLEDGVRAAVGAFPEGGTRPRALLLLGDGEDPARDEEPEAAELAASGARIVAVSFGSEAGAPVPLQNATLRDANGRPVVSRADPARLREFAERTGGALFVTDAFGEADVGAVLGALRRDAGRRGEERVERRVPRSAAGLLAALALAALLAEPFARRRTGAGSALLAPAPQRRRASAAGAAFAAALLGAAAGADPAGDPVAAREQEVRSAPEDAAALQRLGVARGEAGAFEEAERAFFAAAVRAREPRDAADAFYDLGVSALGRGDLEAARDAFFDGIALAPDDRRAKFNLEWTLRALAAQPPPSGGGEPEESPEEPEAGDEGEPGEESPPEASEPQREAEAPQPEARSGEGEEPAPRENPVELDPEAARRWLESVADDPARALQAAARSPEGEGRAAPRSEGPSW